MVLGTFSINQVVAAEPRLDHRWQARSFLTPGRWLHMSTSASSASNLDWLVRLGTFLGTALPALWGLDMVLGKEPWVQTLRWVLIGAVLVGAAVFAWIVVARSSDEE